jgi:hypothetical protein
VLEHNTHLVQRPSGVKGGALLQAFVCRQSLEAPNGPPGKKVARNVKNVPVKWALNPPPKIPPAQIATAPGCGLA